MWTSSRCTFLFVFLPARDLAFLLLDGAEALVSPRTSQPFSRAFSFNHLYLLYSSFYARLSLACHRMHSVALIHNNMTCRPRHSPVIVHCVIIASPNLFESSREPCSTQLPSLAVARLDTLDTKGKNWPHCPPPIHCPYLRALVPVQTRVTFCSSTPFTGVLTQTPLFSPLARSSTPEPRHRNPS